jgi:cytochrome c biogenesis protein ResB
MEAGEALTREATKQAEGWTRKVTLFNPLRAVWWLFTNLRFATILLVILCVVSLVGVLLPQIPSAMRGNPGLEAAWLEAKEDDFGFLTQPMDRLGLFDIFHAGWFAVLLGVTVASTGAYVVSRVPGVWASITRPRKRVPDSYFDVAPVRVTSGEGVDVAAFESLLRRRFYRVERTEEAGATYLFGDRFQWGQAGTLLTHAAVIIFILAAVVSRMDSFEAPLFMAEGETQPLFPVRDPNQLQVELVDTYAGFAASGQPLEYRSDLAIYRNGELVKNCSSTVNSPCGYAGYKFYQSAWFGFGATLEVRDTRNGNVIYRETLALSDKSPAPHVVIRDNSGAVLLDETLVLTDEIDTGDIRYAGTLVTLPDGRILSIGLREAGDTQELLVLEPEASGTGIELALSPGESGGDDSLSVEYTSTEEIPSALVSEIPAPEGAAADGAVGVRLQMSGAPYGTGDTSEGDGDDQTVSGETALTLGGLRTQALRLEPGESETIGPYEYTFIGQREFSGIQAKRDRSDYLVWVGAALIVAGVMITFWVPRRRLWAKISSSGTALAGQAPGHADYAGELRELAARAGAQESPAEEEK